MIVINVQFHLIIINILRLFTLRLTYPPLANTTVHSFVSVSTPILAIISKLQNQKQHIRELTCFLPDRISHLQATNDRCLPFSKLGSISGTLLQGLCLCQQPSHKEYLQVYTPPIQPYIHNIISTFSFLKCSLTIFTSASFQTFKKYQQKKQFYPL